MLEKISKAAKLGILSSLIGIAGCSKQHIEAPVTEQSQQQVTTNTEYSVSLISSEGKKPLDEVLDQVGPNNGYYADLDDDGINDFVIFRKDTLFFSKGIGNNTYQPEVPVVKVRGTVIAYRIDVPAKPRKPYFVYFNDSKKGYSQENMGVNNQGRPIFADAESNSNFDF